MKLVARLEKIPELASFIPLFLNGVALDPCLQLSEDDQKNAETTENRQRGGIFQRTVC